MKKWKTPHVMSGMTRSLNRDMSHMRKPPTSSLTGMFASEDPMMSRAAGVVSEPTSQAIPL